MNIEILDQCKSILLTNNNNINKNITRNNYSYIKKHHPNLWKQIKNKTIFINHKKIIFNELKYKTYIINNIILKIDKLKLKNKIYHDLCVFLDETKELTFKKLLTFLSNKKYKANPLKIFKKYFTKEYDHILNNYYEKGQSDRETIYRYVKCIKNKPKINNIPLRFFCNKYGYENWKLYLHINQLYTNIDIIKYIFDPKNKIKSVKTIKKYYKKIYNTVNKIKGNSISEKFYKYINNLSIPPKCIYCGKKDCHYDCYSVGYTSFCSKTCYYYSKSKQSLLKNVYNLTKFKKYHREVWKLSNYSYNKYKEIINPKNYKRGRIKTKYHIDHIIPVIYGYLNKIKIEYMAHYRNLRIITMNKNLKKGYKMVLNNDQLNILLHDIKRGQYEYYR